MHLDVQQWISHFGYVGVFFILFMEVLGIPFPAETTLTISGFEWTKGVFSLVPIVLVAASGNILGSTIAYGIGYYLGRPVVLRFGRYVGINEKRMNAAQDKFAKYESTIVLFGKFIAGVRVLIPYLAGINRMSFVIFSIYNTISALVWATVFIVLGRYIGVLWNHYHVLIQKDLYWFLIAGVILITAVILVKRALKKRGSQE